MRWMLLATAVVVLTACAREPRVQSSTLDVVTVRYFGDGGSAVDDKAREECGRYGRRAIFRNNISEAGGDKLAIYDCRV
ncbi:MAG TPA: hypothetical protein VF342_09930 [Alphaproteobacteria bacterium]